MKLLLRFLRTTYLVVCGIAMLSLLIVGSLIGWWELYGKYPPNDAVMISAFKEHRQTFEALRQRICGLSSDQRIWINSASSEPPISSTEQREYSSLLRNIGAKNIQMTKHAPGARCSIQILYWARGWAAGGDYKTFTFNGDALFDGETLSSLDALPLHEREIQSFQRKLNDGWAIQYDHWP